MFRDELAMADQMVELLPEQVDKRSGRARYRTRNTLKLEPDGERDTLLELLYQVDQRSGSLSAL